MSLKRVLGVMLASRMAGRGGRGRGLGSAAALGGLGRGGMARKAGLASLAYLAYRHYRDSGGADSGRPGSGGSAGSGTGSGTGGGVGGMIGGVLDSLTGGGGRPGTSAAGPDAGGAPPGADPSEAIDEDRALLLIRAMISAAHADGEFSAEERARIMDRLDEGGADAEDRAQVEREIASPKPLRDILAQVRDPETAQQVYLASRAAVDAQTEANRAYLSNLRQKLNLDDEDVATAEDLASSGG